MTKKYRVYCDPGHGWVAVKRKELKNLGILGSISHFSYQRGNTVYLEEDADASLWVETYMKKFGAKPEFTTKHTNGSSPIRSYESFRAEVSE